MGDIRVLIVDDQEIYRNALSGLLEIVGGYEVVGQAASGEEGIALVARPVRTWCSWISGSPVSTV